MAEHLERLIQRRLVAVQQHIVEQEEHALLQSATRMLQQAALPDEATIGLHHAIEAAEVALQFAQLREVFGCGQDFAHLGGGARQHDQRALAGGAIGVIVVVVREEFCSSDGNT